MPVSDALSSETARQCDYFYGKLVNISHQKILFEKDAAVQDISGEEFKGCRIVFNSNMKLMKGSIHLPSFWADEGTELYKQGWRNEHNYTADGPGSGKYAIINNGFICIIDWDQHSWIDDKTGEIMSSELINMEVQCFDKKLSGKEPPKGAANPRR
ncbi:MAG: hypothetical protein EPN22_16590 [Nitrospirae bacterium]|nr:MAG: hypothetical protein EPN22_16590 [Nitrospirota bacterium]